VVVAAQDAGHRDRLDRLAEEYAAHREAEGLPPDTGRKRRAKPMSYEPVRGRKLADYPELMLDFDPSLNPDIDPTGLAGGSKVVVTWRCHRHPDLHVWKAPVVARATIGAGCTYCMNRAASPTNSLAAMHPEIAAEWHPTENGPLTPDDVLPKADRKIMWLCPNGHTYPQKVYARTFQHQGCPVCAKEGRLTKQRAYQAKRARDRRLLARKADELSERRAEDEAVSENRQLVDPTVLDEEPF